MDMQIHKPRNNHPVAIILQWKCCILLRKFSVHSGRPALQAYQITLFYGYKGLGILAVADVAF